MDILAEQQWKAIFSYSILTLLHTKDVLTVFSLIV
jgi:hypothetical protein